MAARGLIALAIDHLKRQGVGRVDVVYVCSNAAIAQQNVNRLNVLEERHVAMATRLTMLPVHLRNLSGNRVNFVSFTPGTTFKLRSSGGIVPERVLMKRSLAVYRMVFGQPRQEDLLAHLERRMADGLAAEDLERWRISLEPEDVPDWESPAADAVCSPREEEP